MTKYIKNPLSGKLRGVTYEDGKIIDVHIRDTDDVVKVFAPVRHGRWEGYTHSRYCGIDEYGDPVYRDGVVYSCSNPKCRRKTVIKENYCPNCGAKMDLEGETNDD